MQLHALTIQKGLYALGFDPGPRDGKAGPRTVLALKEAANQARLAADIRQAGTCETDGLNWSCSHLEITPDALATTIQAASARYAEMLAANQAVPQTSAPVSAGGTPAAPVTAMAANGGLPFWRMDNTLAWVAVGVPLALGLGWLGWWLYRRGG